jgi:hypothetical protein
LILIGAVLVGVGSYFFIYEGKGLVKKQNENSNAIEIINNSSQIQIYMSKITNV